MTPRKPEVTREQRMNVLRVRALFGRKSGDYVRSSLLTDREGLDLAMRMSRIGPTDLVLDIATGTGYMALAAAEAGAKVVAIDFTPPMLIQASHILQGHGAALLQADAERLPFREQIFDVVTCRISLHHFQKPRIAISEMARVCRRGGRVLLVDVISSEDPGKSDLHNRMGKLRDPSEVRQWRLSELREMMEYAGLSVIESELREHLMNFDEWIRLGSADEETAAQLREMMVDSIDGDRAGLSPRFTEGELYFNWRTGLIVAEK